MADPKEEKKPEKKEEKIKERFVASAVPTQTQPVILDLEEKDTEKQIITLEEALARLLNDIAEIKASL